MSNFASGKYAYGISDRSGFRYRLKDMRKEWNGSLVGFDEFEPKHPQLEPLRYRTDPEALKNPRPDTNDDNIPFVVFTSTGKDIIPSSIEDLTSLTSSVGSVTVTNTSSSRTDVSTSATGFSSSVSVGTSTSIYQLFAVTVVDSGGNKYFLDGVNRTGSAITLTEGSTYKFDQSHSSNSSHPLRFSTTSDGSHGGGSEYTTGVTTYGTPGNAGAYTQITVAASAPTLYYYCTNHSGMGGQANTP
jgi:hypothetical protein